MATQVRVNLGLGGSPMDPGGRNEATGTFVGDIKPQPRPWITPVKRLAGGIFMGNPNPQDPSGQNLLQDWTFMGPPCPTDPSGRNLVQDTDWGDPTERKSGIGMPPPPYRCQDLQLAV